MKYTDTQIGFQEFPDEISLLINISNCPFHCPGCHSPELWEDIGTELTEEELSKLIETNNGITCVGFMGGKPKEVCKLIQKMKYFKFPNLKYGMYWGGKVLPSGEYIGCMDYIKIGRYEKDKGGLSNPNTNQRMYKHVDNNDGSCTLEDITYKFWKHGTKG